LIGWLVDLFIYCNRQLALKALNERLRSVPAGTSWPSMEDDSSESIVTEHNISSPVSSAGHVDNVSSPMLPLETNVNTDVTIDTSAAASTPSSTVSSDTQEQQQH